MPQISRKTLENLSRAAVNLRIAIIGMIAKAGSGHPAGALGLADIFSVLFFHAMQKEDKLVLSNGHTCTVLYAALAQKGIIPEEELESFRKINSRLQGHPHNISLPEITVSSGPLGQGLSQAAGFALANKIDGKPGKIFCITSDAELQEGQTWEAAMFIPNKGLDNVVWIIDRNSIQIGGNTEDVMPLEDLKKKLEAFNWNVLEVDGHNIKKLAIIFDEVLSKKECTAIIAHTIPGKGVKFMEYKFEWHGKAPNREQAEEALRELEPNESAYKD